jgi:acetylornithine deacetylase/succinyl-diaminopimelate desuccinylase-like protein
MVQWLGDFQDWYEENKKNILDEYLALLRFQSISTDPAYAEEVHRCVDWLRGYIDAMGFEVQLWSTSRYPVLFAQYREPGPNYPTLLIYNHYDVQPPDPLELWKDPPFAPALHRDMVFARGASDNKGQLAYVLSAVKAFLQISQEKNINIKLFIEGEEECGSIGTKEAIAAHREQLKADYCLIVDAGIPKRNIPAVTLGMRGITTMQVEVSNSSIDLHSGLFGGVVLNPLRALVEGLSQIWVDGKVAIPGFYKDVVALSEQEGAGIDLTFDENAYRSHFGIHTFAGEPGYSLAQSRLLRPTVELNGIWGGYTGEGFKTVIPAKAYAKISCRLVPNQNAERIGHCVAEFLKAQFSDKMPCKVEILSSDPPFWTAQGGVISRIAAQAFEEVFGERCRYVYSAASVPIATALLAACSGELILIGTSLDEDDIHAPNEHFSLEQFKKGYLIMARLLMLCATQKSVELPPPRSSEFSEYS